MSRPRALVLLNPAARHGRGGGLWQRVRREVEERFDVSIVQTDVEDRWRGEVDRALRSGVRIFVAAGGDGTVHALAEALVERHGELPLGDIRLGAVGLGSSNDYHKPFRTILSGIPIRLDAERARPRDLGRVRWIDGDGREKTNVLVVSSSAGVVAEGNALFSRCRLGRHLPVLFAIGVAALRAIARHRPIRTRLVHDGTSESVELSSLSILKTPWLSGSLRYDVPVALDDGLFGVGLCEGMGRRRLLATLAALARGRFAGRPHTCAFQTASLTLEADTPFLLEIDGEVTPALRASFDLLPDRMLACA